MPGLESIYDPSPADIGFTLGWAAVRLFQRAPGEAPTRVGHVLGAYDERTALEALWEVTESPWAERLHQDSIQMWRHKGINGEIRRRIAGRAYESLGARYGWWKIGLQLADNLAARVAHLGGYHGEIYTFRSLQFLDKYPNCHWLWARAYQEIAGIRFGVAARRTNPDQMHDHVSQSEEWELVYQSPDWPYEATA